MLYFRVHIMSYLVIILLLNVTEAYCLQADTGRSPVKKSAYTTQGDLAQRHLSRKIILRIPIKPLNWQEYMCVYTQREAYFTVFNGKTNYFNVEYLQKYYTRVKTAIQKNT